MINKNKIRNIDYDKIFSESIILIGPMGTGKTTIADELLKRDEIKNKLYHLSLDELSIFHLKRLGYDRKKGNELYESGGYKDFLKYRQGINFKYVKYMLDNIDMPTLLEFGGADTLTVNEEDYKELKECLSEFANVVLILPSSDKSKSLKIIEERWNKDIRGKYEIASFEDMINWHVINNQVDDELATITVYTENKTPAETTDEILELIKERKHII